MPTNNKSLVKLNKCFPGDGNYDVDRRNKEIDELKRTVDGLVKEVKWLNRRVEVREKKFDRLWGSIRSAWNDFDREIKSIQEKPKTHINPLKRKLSEEDILSP
ncbi:hypothetical protein K2173_009886 [Erythroxylum novogranatense]|uniref:Uncharacterized protein n=1 Tax=Erythroxylum novogranatense TaxID=1862640 RepID=A0AAV8T0H1_9ROSI|nr:hypothetical protein K2173_009886 [Erythroxylum novogranatense]